MATTKPWRTLVGVGDAAGRFTREQVEAAVLKVKRERERREAAEAARARKESAGSVPRGDGASEPAGTPARQSRETPKAA